MPAKTLLRSALAVLDHMGYVCDGTEELRIAIRHKGRTLAIRDRLDNGDGVHKPEQLTAPRPTTVPGHWLWFSPLEQTIVDAVKSDRLMTAAEIADAAGEGNSAEFRNTLRNLTSRKVLVAVHGHGYRLGSTDNGE